MTQLRVLLQDWKGKDIFALQSSMIHPLYTAVLDPISSIIWIKGMYNASCDLTHGWENIVHISSCSLDLGVCKLSRAVTQKKQDLNLYNFCGR